MKNYHFIIMVLLMLASSGCNHLAKRIYGIKNPEYERADNILKHQHEIFGSEIPGLTTTAIFQLQLLRGGIPEVYVFDKSGHRLSYSNPDKPDCNAPAEAFLARLDTIKAFPVNHEYTLSTFAGQLMKPGCNRSFKALTDSVDFHVFMTWAVWIGRKIHDDKTKLWIETLKSNHKIRYRLYLVNLDWQECWSAEEKKKFEESMN